MASMRLEDDGMRQNLIEYKKGICKAIRKSWKSLEKTIEVAKLVDPMVKMYFPRYTLANQRLRTAYIPWYR